MPAPTLAEAQAAFDATIEPLRNLMAAIESEITSREAELAELRKQRTETGNKLRAVDPRWAAQRKKPRGKAQWSGPGGLRVSQARLDRVLATLARFNGQPFDAEAVAKASDLHKTTVHKLLKYLHDQGRIQLDHKGGPRRTTNFFKLPPSPEGGNG